MFARCPQFFEEPVQVRFGHQFGGHEVCVPIWRPCVEVPQLEGFSFHVPFVVWRHQHRGPSKAELERRTELFNKKDWPLLLEEARSSATGSRRKCAQLTEEEDLARRARQVEKFVHQGEVSRARQILCSQARAPGTSAILNELRDPERLLSRLTEAIP